MKDPCFIVASVKIQLFFIPVLRVRIRMDPELLPGFGYGIIVPDPDPAKSERGYE